MKSKGLVAQLGERRVRNAEVEGSNPFGSIRCTKEFLVFMKEFPSAYTKEKA